MVEKTLVLEAWTKRQQTPVVLLVQGEAEGRELRFQIVSEGTPVDLSGSSVNFYFETPVGNQIFLPGQIVNAADGLVSVVMTSGAAATVGTVCHTWLRVSLPGGGNLQIPGPVLFIAEGSDTSAIEASDDFSALDEALAATAQFVRHYESLEDISYYTQGMSTQAFLSAMSAFETLIVPGTAEVNFSDAPAQEGTYLLSRGATTANMTAKFYGAGESGEYFFSWDGSANDGPGWTKNATIGDLSGYATTNDLAGYLPLSGGTMSGPIRLPMGVGIQAADTSGAYQTILRRNEQNHVLIGSYGTDSSGDVLANVGNGKDLYVCEAKGDGSGTVNLRRVYHEGNPTQFADSNFITGSATTGGAIARSYLGTSNPSSAAIANTTVTITPSTDSVGAQVYMPQMPAGTGTAVAIATNQYGNLLKQSSARRYKENIAEMSEADGQAVYGLRPVYFNYIGQDVQTAGLIAEEVEESVPAACRYSEVLDGAGNPTGETELESVDYQMVSMLLLREVQRLHGEVEGLNARVEELEKQA